MADGEGAQSGAEGTQSGAGDSTTDNGSTTADNSSTGTQSGTTDSTSDAAAQAKAETEAYRERMKAADQRAAKFEAELKQLRDKDLPEVEKLKRDHQAALEKLAAMEEKGRALALDNAFFSDNSFNWQNPKRALQLIDRDKIEIHEDGTVSGLKEALTALAKSDPYLLKTEAPADEDKTPPGTTPGNNGSNGTSGTKPSAMASRLPVLRTRISGR